MKKPIIYVFIACLIAGLVGVAVVRPRYEEAVAKRDQKHWSRLERAYQWLVAMQRNNRNALGLPRGVFPSHEGGEDCFVYDQALAALVFTHKGDFEKAQAIFSFLDKVRKRHVSVYGSFQGFTDTYKADGTETETRAAGPNAWVLMAVNYYTCKKDDKSFIPLAKDLAEWLISLQSADGGIIGGYYGNGEPMVWISTEHNFDCYAGFRDLGIITADERYLKKAKEVRKWLIDDTWKEDSQRFYLGKRNPNFATDLSSWAVLSLGREYASSLDFAVEKSLNTQLYDVKDIKVEGFDFGSDYKNSPFPDKDAVWFEGTAHMVLSFELAGREEESSHFLDELRKCLTPSDLYPYTHGLPYASNEGTPVYDSWMMQNRPLCISSTAWYYFAEEGFNPFSALGELEVSNRVIDALDYEPAFQNVPLVDNFESSPIIFSTAYPQELIFTKKSTAIVKLSDEVVVDGMHSMSIEFIPEQDAKVSTASVVRSFLYPQDWSMYDTLSIWVYASGTSGEDNNIAHLDVKDREGEVYNSPPVFLNRSGWRKYTFDLWTDFRRSNYDGVTYGDNMFGLSRIIEISFTIQSKHPAERSKLYLDRIELEKKIE